MAENNFSALVQLIVDKAQARSALQRELKELQREAQLETDVKVNLSDVRQARKEIAQANREQQQGTRENIKLRAQELAHARMVAKETKVATDLEIANRQRELKLSNQATSEELANRKRLTQEQKIATQEELASRESIRKLNEQTFKEESSARKRAIAEMKLQAQEERAYKSSIQGQADKIQLLFDNGQGASEYQNRITKITQDFEKYGLSADEASKKTENLRNILLGFKTVDGNFLPDEQLLLQADKFEQEFKAIKVSVDQAKLAYDKFSQPVSNEKATSLIMRINTFLTKNTAITKEARVELESYVNELNKGVNLSRWNELNNKFKETENRMRGLGKLGASLKNQLAQAAESFTQWISVSSAIMLLVSKTKNAVSELKELDNILTEISKTSDLTKQQLEKLGDTAFDSASKYGKKASDYLTGVQEMYRAGFDNAEEMAELSILAQSAGDMDSTLSNDYIMATNAAYKYKGSVEELNNVLDRQNYITNNAAISMKDIADATTETASVAAQYGVQIDELSALIATATANTRESGSEVGTALKAILINLQDTTSKPVTDTFDALGISMTKVVNGTKQLKTPIELIYELADAYNSLPEGDIMRANILNEIGQKRHANTLASILGDMDSLNHMLELYNSNLADNSAYNEAMKSANNWQGSINKLSNSWSDLVQNFANSDVIIKAINLVNGLVQALDKLGAIGSIGLGAGIFAGFKNVGKRRSNYVS